MFRPEVELRYIPSPEPPVPADGGSPSLLGTYEVSFPNGLVYVHPHSGWPGTVGAHPANLEDDEVRKSLIACAERAKWATPTPASPKFGLQPLTEPDLYTLLRALESSTVHGPRGYNDGECRACQLIQRIETLLDIDRKHA